jgi:hypothetical protein
MRLASAYEIFGADKISTSGSGLQRYCGGTVSMLYILESICTSRGLFYFYLFLGVSLL